MTQYTFPILAVMTLLVGCTPSAAQTACSDEYYEGTATFPDGSAHQFCAPARAEGIVIVFDNPVACGVRVAIGAGDGVEGSWEIGGPSDWFKSTGPHELNVVYQPSFDLHPTFCPTGVSGCAFRSATCRFDVTVAASASGQIAEGQLTSPCLLEPSPGDPAPTITAMRFRAHLSTQDVNDMGAMCTYP